MKRKGDLLFFEVSDMKVTPEEVAALGFTDYVPRNDYKSAMIKALKVYKKDESDRFYRRFNDKGDEVSFAIFVEDTSGDYTIQKELIIRVDKVTGVALFTPARLDAETRIMAIYEEGRKSLDAEQIRQMLRKVVRREQYGVPMKKGGGIYFIDAVFDGQRPKLKQLFDRFPTTMQLHTVPIFDNPETAEAVSTAVKEDIFQDIETLIQEIERKFADGSITKKTLESKKNDAMEILAKIDVHRENLQKEVSSVTSKIGKVRAALEKVTADVEEKIMEPGDFMEALRAL